MSTTPAPSQGRLLALDFVRVFALLGVVIYHSAAAYSTNTPYWSDHDGSAAFATGIRELVDVFIMPVFFFLAGYFTLSSFRKRGSWSFFKTKFWELGYIWLLAVVIILPIVYWGVSVKSDGASASFVTYWLNWLGSIGQTSSGVLTSSGQMVHMHFWFVSLLFYFFVVFILVYSLKNGLFRTSAESHQLKLPTQRNILMTLLTFALITSVGYFVSLLLVPDTSWFNVKLFLQLQPAKLFLYAAYFAFGLYAYSKNWFSNGIPLGQLKIWAPLTILLAAVFLIVGQEVFVNPAATTSISPAYLLLFALLRSFFLLSVLVTLVSLAVRFFNRPSRLIQTLSDNSYYIYLIHIFVVTILQGVLMLWPKGPIITKMLIVFFVAVSLSYVLSRWVFKKLTIRDWIARKLNRASAEAAS